MSVAPLALLAAVLATGLAACGGTAPAPAQDQARPPSVPSAVPTRAASPSPPPATPSPAVVTVRYRIEVRTADAATRDAASAIERTLDDPRGWERAGFSLVRDDAAPYVVVLAEADEVDRLCLPYRTFGTYSCQNGPVVALNADRWRTATPKWTGDLATYRQMLVSHEVGHLLGQHHPPEPQCAIPGRPARVMSQQSTELDGCLPNPWPLPDEIALAARHEEPLAPPYER